MSKEPVFDKDGGVLVRLRVSPDAKRTQLRGPYGDAASKLAAAAPTVDGKANAEVERFPAGLVGIAASDVRVMGRSSTRDKAVFVDGVGAEKVREALASRRR